MVFQPSIFRGNLLVSGKVQNTKNDHMAGKSPFSIGNTSSFMLEFSIVMLVFGGGYLGKFLYPRHPVIPPEVGCLVDMFWGSSHTKQEVFAWMSRDHS